MPNPVSAEGERLEAALLRESFSGAGLKFIEKLGDLFVCVPRDRLLEVAEFLRDDDALAYKYISDITCADYSRWTKPRDLQGRFEVIYNLYSPKYFSRLFLKVGLDDGESVPSLITVFPGAEYPEREVWDLFGVVFEGHPKLERFLLPDDWVGFPLRKEFPLGGEDVTFAQGTKGPAVEDEPKPHAGESFEGKTGSEEVSGR